jgi:hypothetical protein
MLMGTPPGNEETEERRVLLVPETVGELVDPAHRANINAMDIRHISIFGHPTGRLLDGREAYEVDMEAQSRLPANADGISN